MRLPGSQYTEVAELEGSAYTRLVQLNRSEYTEARWPCLPLVACFRAGYLARDSAGGSDGELICCFGGGIRSRRPCARPSLLPRTPRCAASLHDRAPVRGRHERADLAQAVQLRWAGRAGIAGDIGY